MKNKLTQSLMFLVLVFFMCSSQGLAGYVRISRNIFEFSETFNRGIGFGDGGWIYVQSGHNLSSEDIIEEDDGMRLDRKDLKIQGNRVIGIDLDGYSYLTFLDHLECPELEFLGSREVYCLRITQSVKDVHSMTNADLDFSVEIPVTISKGSLKSFQHGKSIELEPTRDGQEIFIRWYESRFKIVLTNFYARHRLSIKNIQVKTHYVLETFAQRWWWGPQFRIVVDQNQIEMKVPHIQMKLEADLERILPSL
jgi:hypothetical protein